MLSLVKKLTSNARTTRGKILAKIYSCKGVAPIRMDAPYSTQHCSTACAYCALHIRILAKYEILTRYNTTSPCLRGQKRHTLLQVVDFTNFMQALRINFASDFPYIIVDKLVDEKSLQSTYTQPVYY